MRRRTLLRRSGVVATIALAGCTGQSDGDGEPRRTTEMIEETPTASEPAAGSPTATSSPGSTETPTATPTETAAPATTTTSSATAEQVVRVGPNGEFSFAPSSFEIAAGETVRWTWDSSGHNVRPSVTPDGADWPGTPGGDGTLYDAGYTYSFTFEVTGTYEYYCAPHRSLGMTGAFTVV